MRILDLTLPTPAENLACDEALLEAGETGQGPEVLRFWESPEWFVVLGYATHAGSDVDLEACREQGIPVYRRCSGGGTVLQGPGCLNYALVLQIQTEGPLASIAGANREIMERHRAALAARLGRDVRVQGVTDLTLDSFKFSGNAQRRRHRWLLFHGTFLLAFDLTRMERVLRLPTRQPPYRQHRPHDRFVTNLGLSRDAVKGALRQAWNVEERPPEIPQATIARLVQDRYGKAEWNLRPSPAP